MFICRYIVSRVPVRLLLLQVGMIRLLYFFLYLPEELPADRGRSTVIAECPLSGCVCLQILHVSVPRSVSPDRHRTIRSCVRFSRQNTVKVCGSGICFQHRHIPAWLDSLLITGFPVLVNISVQYDTFTFLAFACIYDVGCFLPRNIMQNVPFGEQYQCFIHLLTGKSAS